VSRDSVIGIATGYGLDDRGFGVVVPIGSIVFSSSRRLDRLWGSPSLFFIIFNVVRFDKQLKHYLDSYLGNMETVMPVSKTWQPEHLLLTIAGSLCHL
jgi:hypothetical protein